MNESENVALVDEIYKNFNTKYRHVVAHHAQTICSLYAHTISSLHAQAHMLSTCPR